MTNQDQPEIAYEIDGQIVTPEQLEQRRLEQLQGIRSEFVTMRDKWVAYRTRSGIEERWAKNAAMFVGDEGADKAGLEDTLKNGPAPKGAKQARSTVVLNITRPKVKQATARMCEILLPVDDKNWGIKPTPVPSVVQKYLGDKTPTADAQGIPTGMTSDQEAQTIIKQSEEAAEAMSKEIDDVLTECSFNSAERQVIADGVKLGTGILLGPIPSTRKNKTWQPMPDGTSIMVMSEETVPASMRANPWDVWFDPSCGNDHQRGKGFFHRRKVTRKEIRALIGVPGYIEAALKTVLRSSPKRLRVAENKVTREDADDDSYELWMYFGDIEPDQMELLSAEGGDPVEDVSTGMLVMINDEIVGVAPSWIPDNSLPCDVWCWEKADDSPYGYGLPDELDHQQRVVNSAWRMVMDNGRFALAPQIVIKGKKITAQNGSNELTPGKIWLANDEVDDVRNAMAAFEFNSHLQELLAIVDAALRFADQETNMPQMLGGERGTAPETVGGMVMLQSNALSVPRLRVKLFDDQITRPHIGRYYDYMMATNPKPEIKGDMEIDARGVSVLLERDIQNQAAMQLANVTSNPRYQGLVDPKKELKVILPAFKIKAEDIMFTDDEIKKMQEAAAQNPQQQDPRIATAEMNLQGKQMDIQDRKEQRQADAQLAQMEMQTKQQNTAYQIERERSEAIQAQTDRQFEREMAIANMDQDGQLTAAELASKERLEMLNLANKRELFSAEAALRVNTGAGI
jgi:hypothetical protein